jgi:putative phage-type endonuclease
MLTQEQIAERTKYIGGSDAAAVLGLSRWSTPLRVWAEKTGQLPIEDKSDVLAIEVGNELEDAVCRLFTKKTGKQVHRVTDTVYHKQHPFLATNLDRRIVGEDAFLEAKTASAWKAKEWAGEDIPREYLIQVMHGLAVTGKQRAYLACLIGGNQKFAMKIVERDDALIQDIIKREVSFWERFVVPKVMPTTIMSGDAETLYGLFPKEDEGKEIELNDEANVLIESITALKADNINLEKQIERSENELRAMLKNAELGKTGLWTVTWKAQVRKTLDAARLREERPEVAAKYEKETSSRVLRIKKQNKGG